MLCALLSQHSALGPMKGDETAVSCICHCSSCLAPSLPKAPPFIVQTEELLREPQIPGLQLLLPVRALRCQCEKLPAAFATGPL